MDLLTSSFETIQREIEAFLSEEFAKTGESYSEASPYGQILLVLNKIRENVALHVKNSVDGFDVELSVDPRVVRNIARTAGHDPGRNISAEGSIIIEKRNGVDLTEIPGGKIQFKNKSRLRCSTNSLVYSINTGKDTIVWDCLKNDSIIFDTIQGEWRTQISSGDGTINQRISLAASEREQPEQFNFEVKVDDEVWTKRTSLFDLKRDEKAYYARTGFNGALDIVFGTGDNGKIPSNGSIIEINWLESEGSFGNLSNSPIDDFIFTDNLIDGEGNDVDFQQFFTTTMLDPFIFGADRENVELTRLILPLVSTNYVLALPEQFEYFVGRLGIFSHIRSWADKGEGKQSGGTVYLNLVPDLTQQLGSGGTFDYFSLPQESFLLGERGRKKVINYLRGNAIMHIGTEIKIVDPFIRRYAIFVTARLREGLNTQTDADNVKDTISNILANTFTYINRRDRIPLSDLLAAFEAVKEIDSVRAQFISERNENYHSNFFKIPTYDPTTSIGIDPEMGDIIFGPNEIPVLRGGWYDRDGNYIADSGSRLSGELGPFNLVIVNPAPIVISN